MQSLQTVTPVHAWSTFKLPSQGVFYGGAMPDGSINVRKLTVMEEMTLQQPGQTLFDKIGVILANCIQLPQGFKYAIPFREAALTFQGADGLLASDRLAVLLFQRTLTFGPEYTLTYNCSACRRGNKHTCNVVNDFGEITPDSLQQRRDEAGDSDGFDATLEPFPVELPDAKRTIFCRFLRGSDEAAILKRAAGGQAAPGMRPQDRSYLFRLASCIVGFEDDQWQQWNMIQRESFLKTLTGADTRAMRREVNRRETGISTDINAGCAFCGQQNELALTCDAEFFFPTSD